MKQEIPVVKGKRYIIEITGLGHSGEGVGRYRDFTVFVPYALPGEQVEVIIAEVKKNYARGSIFTARHIVAERSKPACKIYYKCGGCQLQHMKYPAQLDVKRRQVKDALERIGGLRGVAVHETIGAAQPWYYRNKMQFPVGMNRQEVAIGCFARGTHTIVPIRDCLIQHEVNNTMIRVVREVMQNFGVEAYNERTGQGVVRHIVGRVGSVTGEVMAILVTATPDLPQREQFVHALRVRVPGLVGVVQNINRQRTNVVLGAETAALWGRDFITDRIGAFTFTISARSFFQVNTNQAEVLYEIAAAYAAPTGAETVVDAYCGAGTISLYLARRAQKVYGIEIAAPAVEDANANARRNAVGNAVFLPGDAAVVLPRLVRQGVRPDVVILDPPRAGCAPPVLQTIAGLAPSRIVYVSCNPASLARDLALLAGAGYIVEEAQPVDMFPHTAHVEVACKLTRKDTV